MQDNPRQLTPEQALQYAIRQILDGLGVVKLTTAAQVAQVLRTLAKIGQITWPITGRELANIVAYCVGEGGKGVLEQTPKTMRELKRSGALCENALCDWYRPGPKFPS